MSGLRISVRKLVRDIHSGMEDVGLMEKYALSAEDLNLVYEHLLDGRIPSFIDVSRNIQHRLSPRTYIFFALPIYDAEDPEDRGVVNDLSLSGLQVSGIDTAVGEKRTFVIQHHLFLPDDPVQFEAGCRWTAQDDSDWECISGFEITAISPEAKARLQELIDHLTMGETF